MSSIVGRAKDLIISGGFNVYPIEIEAEIDALDGVAESAVIGLPHPDFGEGVTAVVVHERRSAPFRGSGSAPRCTIVWRATNCPSACSSSKRLPRNAMGKVQKNALRERYKGLYDK